jgi:hypothetical protein
MRTGSESLPRLDPEAEATATENAITLPPSGGLQCVSEEPILPSQDLI